MVTSEKNSGSSAILRVILPSCEFFCSCRYCSFMAEFLEVVDSLMSDEGLAAITSPKGFRRGLPSLLFDEALSSSISG